jgi:hypothetical protein
LKPLGGLFHGDFARAVERQLGGGEKAFGLLSTAIVCRPWTPECPWWPELAFAQRVYAYAGGKLMQKKLALPPVVRRHGMRMCRKTGIFVGQGALGAKDLGSGADTQEARDGNVGHRAVADETTGANN